MFRYFLEVAYNGQSHSGFQIQKNAPSIQGEVNHSLETILKIPITTYGSSRTDTGVHAYQNFLHLDVDRPLDLNKKYNINAILPPTIALRRIYPVKPEAHARFDAFARSYRYVLYKQKDPFLRDFGYFFPYPLDLEKMKIVASGLVGRHDFMSFSKRNTQVNNFYCQIMDIGWTREGETLIFNIKANRFLRGMVRGLVATMLKVGRGKMEVEEFDRILKAEKCGTADFAAPPQGLFLEKVHYPEKIFQ